MNVEIFVTSRSEISIQLNFQNILKILHQDLILHDVFCSVIEHDISVFLRHKLHQIEKKHNLQNWSNEEKIKLLIQRSNCLFIYVTTVCYFVENLNWLLKEQLSLILQRDLKSERSIVKLNEMYIQVLQCFLIKDQCYNHTRLELTEWVKHKNCVVFSMRWRVKCQLNHENVKLTLSRLSWFFESQLLFYIERIVSLMETIMFNSIQVINYWFTLHRALKLLYQQAQTSSPNIWGISDQDVTLWTLLQYKNDNQCTEVSFDKLSQPSRSSAND